MKRLRKKAEELDKVIKLAYDRFDGLQKMREIIQDWEIGEVRNLSGNICKLVAKEGNFARFGTIIPVGEKFDIHAHPETEIIKIIEGEMKDNILEGIWKEGDILIIPPLTEHEPYNSGNILLTLEVDFKW